MNPLRRLAGQTAIYGLSNIIGRLLNYLLVPVYTRVFMPAEYGVVTELYAYVALFYVILTYGMQTAFFRFSRDEEKHENVYGTSLLSVIATSSVFIILATLFSGRIAHWLDYSNHVEYIVWFVLILGMDAVTAIPYALLRQQNRPIRFATIQLINIGANLGLNLFFIVFCPWILKQHPDGSYAALVNLIYSPSIGVGYIFMINLFTSLLTLLLLLPEITKANWKFNFGLWKQMMLYALPLLIMGLAGSINESFDRILLKYLLPDASTAMAQIGIYGACYKISILMTIFIQTFRFAAEPFFFNESKQKDAKQVYARVMNWFIFVCSFIFLATMVYIDYVKRYVGVNFYEGLNIVPILLLANLFLGVFYNLSIWYKLTNKTMYGAYISIGGALLTLVLNFILIPVLGYLGSAWATFFCYAAMMIASYFTGRRQYPVPYNLRKTLSILGLAVFLYFVNNWIHSLINIHYLLLGTLILILFLLPVLFVILRPFKRELA